MLGDSRESAWKIAYHRGALSSTLVRLGKFRGVMMSVTLSEAEVEPHLDKIRSRYTEVSLSVGCINSTKNVTVTRSEIAIDALKSILDAEYISCKKLKVNVAYHSPYMDEIAGRYGELLKDLYAGSTSESPIMVSSVTGSIIPAEDLHQSKYWVRNMVSTVRFSDALSKICSQSSKATRKKLGVHGAGVITHDLLEVGPHSALKGPIGEFLNQLTVSRTITYNSMLIRYQSAVDTSLTAAGNLYCLGYLVNISEINAYNTKLPARPMVLTDLPEYSFNHTKNYWQESRVSKDFRFRTNPPNSFLGSTTPGRNPFEARWRNIIRLSENPWIKDHKINGSYLYPAAGMLVMAIEAAKQTADQTREVAGYSFKNVTFSKALVISLEPEGVEVQFYLRPLKNISDIRNEFRLLCLEGAKWAENCSGSVSVEYVESHPCKEFDRDQEYEAQQFKKLLRESRMIQHQSVESTKFYRKLNDWGFEYGQAFQREEAGALLQLSKSTSLSDDCVIHPAVIDGMGHLSLTVISKGGTKPIPTMIPTRIRKAWIGNAGFHQKDVEYMNGCARATFNGYRKVDSSVMAFDHAGSNLLVVLEGFEMTVLESPSTTLAIQEFEKQMFFNIDWKPDFNLLDTQQLFAYCEAARPAITQPFAFCEDLEFLSLLYITKALNAVQELDFSKFKPHIKKYILWMQMKRDQFDAGKLFISRPEWGDYLNDQNYHDELLERITCTNIQGRFYGEITKNLVKIITEEIDGLEFFFKDDLVSDFYRDAEGPVTCFNILARYLDVLAHQDSGMRILEVGAGTGSATVPILDVLMRHGDAEFGAPRFEHYDYTDISPSFFTTARQKFKSSKDRMRFASLDIEKDPYQQGFKAESYDLIIASNVLHATRDLSLTLQNTRRLLKPGGKLLLFEAINPNIMRTGFAFGLLPGWWLSVEKNRQNGPTMLEQDWHNILLQNGFSSTDLIFRDYVDDRCYETSMMVSTALGSPSHTHICPVPEVTVVIGEGSCDQQLLFAQKIKAGVEQLQSPDCHIMSVSEIDLVEDLSQIFLIFLPEVDRPLLSGMNSVEFERVKRVILSAKGLLWVTKGGQSAAKPDFGMVTGLFRTLCSEDSSLDILMLALDNTDIASARHVENILKIFQKTINSPAEHRETEYAEINGLLHINRVVEANYLNRDIHQKTTMQHSEDLEFGKAPPLTLSIKSLGLLDSLTFLEDPEFARPLAVNEIEVEVVTSGLNFMDVLIALGQVTEKCFGVECAGIVTRVGAEADLQPGDRVCVCTLDTFRTYVRCNTSCAIKISEHISFEVAAALTATSVTAYYALHVAARLRPGESVLIHSGAGGTGQAAIQVAQAIGAVIYTTVSSEEKKKLLVKCYNLSENHNFYSRDNSSARGIRKMTQNHGVDVVLNSLSGESLLASWECIAPFGRFIEIGKKDIYSHENLPMFSFANNVTFAAVDIAHFTRHRSKMIRDMLEEVMSLVMEQKLAPAQPLHIYSVSQIAQAFRWLQSGKNPGKLVIDMGKANRIPTMLEIKPTYSFDNNATYLISGGLGGLGRSIARWMVERGARNLILPSRSGPNGQKAQSLIRDLNAAGALIEAPICDVTSLDSLSSILRQCGQAMPAIKECIQASVVLKDSVFERMDYESWRAAVEPKVQGSWNLHHLLPKNMDFFILLSSMSGIFGARGQSNYASGNTYQDALARHRNAIGEKAVSLNLGMMLEVGLVAESQSIQDGMNAAGFYVRISEAELHSLLDRYCNCSLRLLSPLESQIVMGLDTLAAMLALKMREPYWMQKPLFRQFWQLTGPAGFSSAESSHEPAFDAATRLRTAESLHDATAVVCEALVKKLSTALSIPQEDLDPNKPLHHYGVDSLVAVELRSGFAKELHADIAIFEIIGATSVIAVSALVASKSLWWNSK